MKNVLYSLRLLGVVVDLHGDKASLVCVVDPAAAERMSRHLAKAAFETEQVQRSEAQRVRSVQEERLL